MIRDPYHWEILENIDLGGYLSKYPPEFSFKIDHFYYIIEYLSMGMESDDVDKNEGYVNLNAQKLQSKIHNYKQYLDHLLKYSFILTDGHYVPGEKSRGYVISGYRSSDSTAIKHIPIKDYVTKKKRRKEIDEHKASLKRTERTHKHLTAWFNKDLRIDFKQAEKLLIKLYPPHTGPIGGKEKRKPSRYTKILIATHALDKFHRQQFYYTVDKSVVRFHSNLTNLKKELRNHLTYDHQPLVNIDIKNSQPLLSQILLNKSFYNPKSSLNIHQYSHIFQSITSITSSRFSLMLEECLESIDNSRLTSYINMVNSGDFYRQLSHKMYPDKEFDKKKTKKAMMMTFFSDNRFISDNKFNDNWDASDKRLFKAHFPVVYEVFSLIKRKEKSLLARILQSIESDIIVNRASKRIAKERPDLPIFTIHDSIATTLGNEDYVATIITEEVKNLTDLDVQLGYEYWMF